MVTLLDEIMADFPDSSLERISAATADEVRQKHPGIPDDYLQVLREVGHGTIGRGELVLYSGPVSAASVFSDARAGLPLVLVGDDVAGHHLGYLTDRRPWAFAEFDHCDQVASPTTSLSSWLADFVAGEG